jgi:hypothetical protein
VQGAHEEARRGGHEAARHFPRPQGQEEHTLTDGSGSYRGNRELIAPFLLPCANFVFVVGMRFCIFEESIVSRSGEERLFIA